MQRDFSSYRNVLAGITLLVANSFFILVFIGIGYGGLYGVQANLIIAYLLLVLPMNVTIAITWWWFHRHTSLINDHPALASCPPCKLHDDNGVECYVC
ncbi:MAG: hypothetical protein RBG13Loki_3245 [Promethearchaeota archaeon CR_4]|nr:MAG: hypothetical protein RBG13Loki_3245 [Candidatus Lokiarchaeota archaeon CR_4]